jgi:hypothetical protein
MYQIKTSVILAVLLSVASVLCSAQTWTNIDRQQYEQLTAEARNLFKSNRYSYKMAYSSYIGHHTSTPHDQAQGYVVRYGNDYFADMPGNRSAQGNGIRIMIDDEEKLIVLLDPDYKLDQSVAEAFYESMFLYADSLLSRNAGPERYFRFYYSEKSEFYCQEVKLDHKGLPSEITIFYRDELSLNPEEEASEMEKPKLVIRLSDIQPVSDFPSEFKIDSFVKKTTSGFSSTGNYSGYQVVDYRF